MFRHFLQVLFAALLVSKFAGPTSSRAAEPGKDDETTTRVVRFVTLRSTSPTSNFLIVAPAEGGAPLKLVQSQELATKFISIFMAKPPRFLKVTYRRARTADGTLTAFEAYDAPRELESPNAWVFGGLSDQKGAAGQTVTAIKLSKFDLQRVAVLPNKPVAGKPAPDPALLEKINAFKVGDIIEVEVQTLRTQAVLIDVDTYREPRGGDFVKIENLKVDGKTVPGVALLIDQKPQSFLLPAIGPGAPPSVAATIAAARSLKGGSQILFTARESVVGAPPTLREIRLDAALKPGINGNTSVGTPYAIFDFEISERGGCQVSGRKAYGHADAAAFDNGIRLIANFPGRGAKFGITAETTQKLHTLWRGYEGRGYDLAPRERQAFAAAYMTWHDAKEGAARDRAEQQLCAIGAELSQRVRAEMEGYLTTYRGILTAEQVKEVTKMGEGD